MTTPQLHFIIRAHSKHCPNCITGRFECQRSIAHFHNWLWS